MGCRAIDDNNNNNNNNNKGKSSLCLTKQYAMEAYEGVNV
jgi:hypothetical protein